MVLVFHSLPIQPNFIIRILSTFMMCDGGDGGDGGVRLHRPSVQSRLELLPSVQSRPSK